MPTRLAVKKVNSRSSHTVRLGHMSIHSKNRRPRPPLSMFSGRTQQRMFRERRSQQRTCEISQESKYLLVKQLARGSWKERGSSCTSPEKGPHQNVCIFQQRTNS
eukprot:scpid107665/ scgid21342/ 